MFTKFHSLRKQGFTLLELIIVVIIIGVLASLALIGFGQIIQYSYAVEALSYMGYLRKEMYYCYTSQNGDYTGCYAFLDIIYQRLSVIALDDEDGVLPPVAAKVNFLYKINVIDKDNFKIIARRTTRNGGDGLSKIFMTMTATGLTKSGTKIFKAIR